MKTDVQVNFVINGTLKKIRKKNIGYLLPTTNTLPYQKKMFFSEQKYELSKVKTRHLKNILVARYYFIMPQI